LFYVGVAFAYLLVFPAAFKFLVTTTPAIAQYLPEIASFLDVATLLSLVFGLAFEIPVATILLLWTGIVRITTLTQNRGYVIIGLAVFTAMVTPPDPISMLLMLIPMYLLYEAGILAARIMLKDKIAAQAEEERQEHAAS
jgi:sec-independent protein translocase protein TatC